MKTPQFNMFTTDSKFYPLKKMETNKKLRLIIGLQMVTIILLIAGMVWQETQHNSKLVATNAAGEVAVVQDERLKTVDQLPDQLFSVSTALSDIIPVATAKTRTELYRTFFTSFRKPLPGGGPTPRPEPGMPDRGSLYFLFHGQEAQAKPISVVSYHIEAKHLQDLLNQKNGDTLANVVSIFPAFRSITPTPDYTFVLAAGVKNSLGNITLIKNRTVAKPGQTTPVDPTESVVYDELGPCPANCPGFQ